MTGVIDFRGHSWLKITGDALTPSRFWDYQLLTDSEYEQRSELENLGFRRVTPEDLPLFERVFPNQKQD